MIERIKHSTGLLVVVLLIVGFYAMSLAVVSYAQSLDELYTSVTILSQAPTVTNVAIGNAAPITLTEATTTLVTCSGTVSAAGGYADVTAVTSTLYRYGVAATCTPANTNDNDCYVGTCVTSSGSGTDMHVVCSAYLWYHADSTDASSTWPTQGWQCKINAVSGGGPGEGTSATQTLYSLAAHSWSPNIIPYGSRSPNTLHQSYFRPTTTVYNTGNVPINADFIGSDLQNQSNLGIFIPTENQWFATKTDWTGQVQLNADNTTYVLGDLGQTVKPTSHVATSNVSTAIGWGLDVPNAQAPGVYYGTNTTTAVFK
jgi:hypothetical protein